jgi:hypothetical protein
MGQSGRRVTPRDWKGRLGSVSQGGLFVPRVLLSPVIVLVFQPCIQHVFVQSCISVSTHVRDLNVMLFVVVVYATEH